MLFEIPAVTEYQGGTIDIQIEWTREQIQEYDNAHFWQRFPVNTFEQIFETLPD